MLESNRTPQQQSTSIGVQTHAYGLVFQDFDVIFWINYRTITLLNDGKTIGSFIFTNI